MSIERRNATKGVAELEAEIEAMMQKESEPPKAQSAPTPPAPVKEEDPVEESNDPWAKRYSNLRSHSAKKENELKKRIEALEAKLAEAPSEKLPSNVEEVKAWVEKYPQVAGIVRSIAREESEREVGAVKPQVAEITELKEKIARAEAEAEIVKAHPDFFEISAADEFHDWVEGQSKAIQNSVYDGDVEDTIAILSLYKRVADIKPNARKEAAMDIPRRRGAAPSDAPRKGAFTETQVKHMSADEFEKKEKEISKSIADGTFVYDISGAAR